MNAFQGKSTQQLNRSSNIELFRIVAMIAIVVHHYVLHSGLLTNYVDANPLANRSVFLSVLGMWGKTGINCFVLITGYYMCKSHITVRKFVKMICQIEFYNILITFIFVGYGYDYHFTEVVKDILPIKDVSDKFVSCFLLFWLTIPFLNASISQMSRLQHKWITILLLTIYIVLPYIPGFRVWYNYVIWFSVLYLVSSYVRLYGLFLNRSLWFWTFASIFSIILAISSVVFLNYMNAKGSWSCWRYWLVSDSNAPLAFLVALCLFMMFKNMQLPHSKFINLIGGSTFGIYLIHDNSDAMRKWLWNDFLHISNTCSNDIVYLCAIVVPIGVFISCSIIEIIRKKLVETPMMMLYDNLV